MRPTVASTVIHIQGLSLSSGQILIFLTFSCLPDSKIQMEKLLPSKPESVHGSITKNLFLTPTSSSLSTGKGGQGPFPLFGGGAFAVQTQSLGPFGQ